MSLIVDRRHKGRGKKNKDTGENVDIEVLRKEYRNMQANRSAFANESDLVGIVLLHSLH
jgi:hypothetical protein